MNIAKYFASIGFDVDTKGLKKVDKALDTLEKKLKKFNGFGNSLNFGIGNFTVDQRKLERVLGNALDIASNRIVFDINKFVVNQAALNQTVAVAMARAGMAHPVRVTPQIVPGHVPAVVTPNGRTREAAGAVRGHGMPNLLGPAIALGLGGYGLANLNQRNQQVVSAQLQTTAVVQQAGGTAAQGADSFQYLRSEGQRIGFNFLDASQDYNKLISGLTGSGIGLKESQKVFSGFAELARVNKLDKTTQNRLFRALSQVAGKGKLMSEELTGQIAEALPGGTALFAQAYQAKIGGNKTGADAIQQLLADMKKGKVTSDILTYAGAAASQRANQGGALGLASQASQAEQARYQNSMNDMAVLASGSGVEEGFARIFRTLNAGLSESGDLVRRLSEGFNEATKWADDLLLFPQSFMRALEGKDSLVADWLGADKTKQLQSDWNNIKQIFTDISSIKFDFLPTLEATAKEIASIMGAIAEFQKWKNGALPTEKTNASSTEKATFLGMEYASPAAIVGDIFNNTGFNLNKARLRGRAVYEDTASPYYQNPELYDSDKELNYQNYLNLSAMSKDPTGQKIADAIRTAEQEDLLTATLKNSLLPGSGLKGYGLDNLSPLESSVGLYRDNIQTPEDISSQSRDAALAAAEDKASGIVNNNSNQISIEVNVDGSTLVGMDPDAQAHAIGEAVANMFVQSFDQVNVNFPIK